MPNYRQKMPYYRQKCRSQILYNICKKCISKKNSKKKLQNLRPSDILFVCPTLKSTRNSFLPVFEKVDLKHNAVKSINCIKIFAATENPKILTALFPFPNLGNKKSARKQKERKKRRMLTA